MMGEAPGILIAFAAGLLSFLSPCVLPLIPSYISIVGGTSLSELKKNESNKWSIFYRTVFFVAGFWVVFTVLGIALSGSFLLASRLSGAINIIAGLLVIFFGLHIIFDFWKMLNIEKRMHVKGKPAGAVGTFLMGMAFGAGWSPCVGPILASILFYASQEGSLFHAAFLLTVYSLGLGVPFLLAGLFFTQFNKQMLHFKKHMHLIKWISGGFLIFIGVLILFGRMQNISAFFFQISAQLGQAAETAPVVTHMGFTIFYLLLGFIPIGYGILKKRTLPDYRIILPGKMIWFSMLLILAGLEAFGVINSAQLIASWMSFQGL
ncbi:MAG: cytochrome c biogenesis protein CcdA [Spirochaetia bacterium]